MTLFRAIAALLAGLGLLPFFWAGFVSGDLGVARVTLIDPIIVAAICLAVGIYAPERVRFALTNVAKDVRGIPGPIFLAICGLFIVTIGWFVARVAYNGQPALTDELTQAFQAGIVMSGRLAAIPETYREFFETGQTLNVHGRWFGEYPIGSGVLSAISRWTRLELFIYPLLLALAAIATWSFVRRAYDETTARLAVILLALSPFAFLLAATRMNHVPTLALTAITLAALTRVVTPSATRGLRFGWAAILGASLGGMVLFRPYDAMLVAIPVVVFQIVAVIRRRELLPSLGLELLACMAVASIQFWVNKQTTGAPFLFGYAALNGPLHGPGFHLDPLGIPFTPSRGFDYVMLYLQQLNTSLFESAVPGLVFIVIGMWLTKPTRWDWLLAGLIVSFLAGYGAYWHKGELNGPRFLYPALIAFVVFTARFVIPAARTGRRIALGAALMVPVCVGLAFVPLGDRSTGVFHRLRLIRTLPVSRSENPAAEAKAAGLKNALVFVREPFHARLAARLRALGMQPFDAERAVTDVDACGLMNGLAMSDARADLPNLERLRIALNEAMRAGKPQPVPGTAGFTALSLVDGRPSTAACQREMAEDSLGTLYFARFLAAATFDSTGRLGGDVIYARTLGARDSVLLLNERFATREWYMYRREDRKNSGRFERLR